MVKQFILIIFVSIASNVFAEELYIANGFLTGEEYLRFTSEEKRAYAMGVVNGMLLAPFFGASKQKMQNFQNCIAKMTDTQVSAILTKHLQDNPGQWHQTPHVPMYNALIKICPK